MAKDASTSKGMGVWTDIRTSMQIGMSNSHEGHLNMQKNMTWTEAGGRSVCPLFR